MKTSCILFAIIGLGAFSLESVFAAEPSRPPPERAPRKFADRAHGSPARIEPNFAKSGLVAPFKAQSKRASPRQLAQPAPKKPATAANGVRMMHKTENHRGPLTLSPRYGGTATLGPGLSHSRSATPASLGGLTTTSAKHSTAALDGAAVTRKP
jgi:hypothetical protein